MPGGQIMLSVNPADDVKLDTVSPPNRPTEPSYGSSSQQTFIPSESETLEVYP